jgi:DNA-binding transcriptional LysR family regulator
MDLRRVRTFITVVELGTVSKAALRLRISQPALSRQLADFEQELGLKLFDRVGRRLRLTGQGEQLLGDCRGLLTYAATLGERAQQLRRGDVGVLKVGATPLHIEGVLSQFLHRYAQHYPNVQVQMTEGSGREILAMLERGEIDLGQMLPYAVQLREGRFGSQQLVQVELLAAFHPSMALGNRGAIEVGRLAAYPLLLLDGGFGLRRAFEAACRLAGVKPKILFESRAPHTLLAVAEAGHGVAIIGSAFRTHRYDLQIVRVTYRGQPLREPLAVLWDKRRPLPHYATTFCEMWAKHVREVFPITRPSEPKDTAREKRPAAR